jgi:alanyl-tRNA synthetase
VWDTDVMRPLIERASSITGKTYGRDDKVDVSLRILAEHARSGSMLVNDGVWPSNDGRGYVLRRIIRRAVRHAYLQGAEKLVMPDLVTTAIEVMGDAYPDLKANADLVTSVMVREEEQFRRTLAKGLTIFSERVGASGGSKLSGSDAFLLHDTYGFPLEVTKEIADERSIAVDEAGFDVEMAEQRRRAKEARKGGNVDETRQREYRDIADTHGQTMFTGYADDMSDVRVLSVLHNDDGTVEVFLDQTPFYATAAPSSPRPGASRCSTPRSPCRGCAVTPASRSTVWCRQARSPPLRWTPSVATTSARTTPAPTCCTGRCARCSART